MTDTNAGGLDTVLKQLGPFGRYNVINYMLFLYPCFLAGMYGSVYVFEASDINYRCEIKECETSNNSAWIEFGIPQDKGSLSKCERYSFKNSTLNNGTCTQDMFDNHLREKCDTYVYSDEDSAVKDFNLGCENWKRTLIGTIHNSGLFVSLPLTGIMSDRFGRKKALAVASLMNCIFGVMRSFSVNYLMMVACEFCEAAFGAGAYSTAFVLAMELVGPKGRVFGNTLINVFYVCGLMTLAGLSWVLQDWRTLLRVIYSPACLVFSYIWILNESIRWLLSKGKHEKAVEILRKAAKMNKVELSEQDLTPIYELDKVKATKDKDYLVVSAEGPSIFQQVIRSSIIIKRLLTCSYLWITCTFVYYGLSINSVSLAGNKYVNFMLVAFVEIPANFACLAVLDRFGRKRVLITMYILSAILCIGLAFIPKDKAWWSLIVYLSGKFSITIAYSSVYIYVSEVFPTNVRQSLLAVCSSTGRIGSTLAPLTPLLALYYEKLPVIFFGTLAVLAGMLVFTLPETINVRLPDTIEEAERLSNRKNEENLS
ncbi:organic cation transporter protein-like [Bombyx mandarina]|uniref:Organic cation transporter protein-like n=1 Tax=Bombyx mandarina TaxID=7092 RepID=A0A6J2JG85_BOMMA|nr:organic cation transporter protein-like [Bombyx mandarina]XP_028027459.1 organic cation transporter protein-like [Bombyx mandarina]